MLYLVYFVFSLQPLNIFKLCASIQHPKMYRTTMMNPVGDKFDHVRRVIVALESPVLPKLDVKRTVDDAEWDITAQRKQTAQTWNHKMKYMQQEAKNMCIALMRIDNGYAGTVGRDDSRSRKTLTDTDNHSESVMEMIVTEEDSPIVQNILNKDKGFRHFKYMKEQSSSWQTVWECQTYRIYPQQKENRTQPNEQNQITTTARFTLIFGRQGDSEPDTLQFTIIKPTPARDSI